jgi:hypothetical protein
MASARSTRSDVVVESQSGEAADRRAPAGERRTYNRRAAPAVTPPYYEAFERIAVAIERIGVLLDQRLERREVRLPDAGGAEPGAGRHRPERRQAVPPRRSTE